MKALVDALLRYTERCPGEGPHEGPHEAAGRMLILRSDHPKPPAHMVMSPSVCIVAQGAKLATFGSEQLEYQAGQALVISVEAPSVGQVVKASPGKPCLVLAFELDFETLRGVAEEVGEPLRSGGETGRGVLVTEVQEPLADCALRMVRLLDTPRAIPVLYPIIMREICYWLLIGPNGGDIARMTLAGGRSQFLIDALRSLKDRFHEPVRIEALAAMARMSLSAFHRQFKALTCMTPIQYQKQLRLLEARRLMVSCATTVEAACFQVGYESPSQFSREYTRMFGRPPKRDVAAMRTALSEKSPNRARAVVRISPAVYGMPT